MPLSPKDFDALPPQGQPGDLPYRLMELLRREDAAYSVTELAGMLLGQRAGWSLHYNPQVAMLLPALRVVLAALCEQGEIEARSKDGLAGPETYYRRKE